MCCKRERENRRIFCEECAKKMEIHRVMDTNQNGRMADTQEVLGKDRHGHPAMQQGCTHHTLRERERGQGGKNAG